MFDLRAARRALGSYRGAGLATRAFLGLRYLVVPVGALERQVRGLGGRVLSVGCGHGLLERHLAAVNPALRIDGLELDRTRVELAKRTADRFPAVNVSCGDVTRLPVTAVGYDAVLAVDLLHHLEPPAQEQALAGLWRALRPGGVLLLKEIDTAPSWKHAWNAFHDRIVARQAVHCRSREEMAVLVTEAGFEVDLARTVRHSAPYPHYLVRARRPVH
jgi:2-polyprenyl-3-methyl-5-hydroxy-6-metoxy-1,4-benzoquinol methylase